MIRVERTARFSAPVSEVFAFVADFRTLTEYNPSIRHVRSLTPGPPAKGSRFELTLSTFGWRLRPILTITDLKVDEWISTRLDAFVPANEKRVFQPEGDATLFFFTIEFASGWPLVGSLVDRLLARGFATPQADMEIRLLEERFNPSHTVQTN